MRKSTSPSTRKPLPVVLIVDDVEEEASAAATLLKGVVTPLPRAPEDVEDKDLERAKLVLLDFKIEQWPARDDQTAPSLKPQDGLALAAILRSNIRVDKPKFPTAFALRSGKLSELSGTLTYKGREHVIARMLDLEWVFAKSMDAAEFARQVRSLAVAVARLPRFVPSPERRRTELVKLLALPKSCKWKSSALEDIDRCSPPEDISADTSKGLALVRWLLQEILPYPCFLLDERYLAARLHVDPRVLRGFFQRSDGARMLRVLRQFEYIGLLNDFLGRRWWRAGIEHWIWQETKGRSFDRVALAELLRKVSGGTLELARHQKPVVSIDDHFRPTDTLIELEQAIQLNPDSWPEFADPPWARLDRVLENSALQARVIARDRDRVDSTRRKSPKR